MNNDTSGTRTWDIVTGELVGGKYYTKEEFMKIRRRRNLLFVSSFILYLIISAAFILF